VKSFIPILVVLLMGCGVSDPPNISARPDTKTTDSGPLSDADLGITVESEFPFSLDVGSIKYAYSGVIASINPCTDPVKDCPSTYFKCTPASACNAICVDNNSYCALTITPTTNFVADFAKDVTKKTSKTIFSIAEVQKVSIVIDSNSLPADISNLKLSVSGEELAAVSDTVKRGETPTLTPAIVQDGQIALDDASPKVLHPATISMQAYSVIMRGAKLPLTGKITGNVLIKMNFSL